MRDAREIKRGREARERREREREVAMQHIGLASWDSPAVLSRSCFVMAVLCCGCCCLVLYARVLPFSVPGGGSWFLVLGAHDVLLSTPPPPSRQAYACSRLRCCVLTRENTPNVSHLASCHITSSHVASPRLDRCAPACPTSVHKHPLRPEGTTTKPSICSPGRSKLTRYSILCLFCMQSGMF